jgi:hypothetical protein
MDGFSGIAMGVWTATGRSTGAPPRSFLRTEEWKNETSRGWLKYWENRVVTV